jgi:ADP-L-glycero-D-manno-heptose 6-epimerase
MSKFLITGASGFIGSNLVNNLLDMGHEVTCIGRIDEQPVRCLSYTFHDINWKSIGQIDGIFHQAAITNTLHPNKTDFNLINFEYTKSLFEAAKHNVKSIVYASSCGVYGDVPTPFREDGPTKPLNLYSQSKLDLDQWAMKWSLANRVKVVGLRYSNVYGAGESHKGKSASMIYQLAKSISRGIRPRLFEHGEQKRDFVYIEDVMTANRLALSAPSGVYNVGSGSATSFNDIVNHLNATLSTDVKPEYFPNPHQSVYQNSTLCDLSLSKDRLCYFPLYDIASGIKAYHQSGKLVS